MKLRFLLMLFTVLIAANAISQHGSGTAWLDKLDDPTANFYEIVAAADSFYSNADSADIQNFTLSPKHFGYWYRFWLPRLDSDGTRISAFDAARDVYYDTNYCTTNPLIPYWSEMGPDVVAKGNNSAKGVGYIEEAWIKPSNHNVMFIGTDGGGVFKTTDGGQTWTDIMSATRIPGIRVRALEVNPANEDHIYVSIGKKGYGLGLIRTTDGGNTWHATALTKDQQNNYLGGITKKLITDPNSFGNAYALTSEKLYRTFNGFQSATMLDTVPADEEWITMAQNPSDYVFYSSQRTLHRYDPGSGIVTDLTANLNWNHTNAISYEQVLVCEAASSPNSIFALQERVRVDTIINGNDTNVVKSTWVSFYVSNNNGNSFTEVLDFHQTNYPGIRQDLAASVTDPNIFYVSGEVMAQRIYKDGSTWKYDQEWSTNSLGFSNYQHADVRDIDVLTAGGQDEVFWSTDGGLFRSVGSDFTNLTTKDLCLWIVNGFVDVDGSEEIYCGVYHGGNNFRDKTGTWRTTFGADGGEWAIADGDYDLLVAGSNNALGRYRRNGTYVSNQLPVPGEGWWHYVAFPIETKFQTQDSFYIASNDLRVYDWSQHAFVQNLTSGLNLSLIRDVESLENNGNIIIFSNHRNADNDSALFKSVNGGQSWTDIATGLNVDAVINTIFIHPNNPDEIWVGMDGFIPGKRVYVTYDNGANWHNKSDNLWLYPISDFAYDAVADVLYVGTDYGVYYMDKSDTANDWHCYYKNLPASYIMALDVNYCTKKLIAATYGRGFHHVDLYQLNEHTGAGTTLSDTTIADNKEFYSPGSINITGTVTIEGIVYMNEDAKIYVPPGAKLIVDGGTITNSCGGLWGGIVAWGDDHSATSGQKPFSQSLASKHGIVHILDNALIENAHTAICLGREDMNFRQGGIISAANSEFRNNYQSIKFLSYHNYLPVSPYTEKNNISTIKNCTFVNDGKLDDPQLVEPFAQIVMHDVKGLHIQGCTFTDLTEWNSPYRLNIGRIGIKSWDAVFSVDPICSAQQMFSSNNACWNQSNADSNSFSGYMQAISVENWNSISPVTVRGAKFENNRHAMVSWGGDMAEIYKNNILHDSPANTSALNLIGSTGYFVEENNVTGIGNYFGIIVGNSGADENEIRNNRFENLSTASQFLGTNDGNGIYDGTQYLCNEMVNTTRNVSVYGGDVGLYQGACNQGASNANSTPANNDFSSTCNSISHFDVSKPSNQSIYYAHLTGEEPVCYSNDVILDPCGGFVTGSGERCPLSVKSNPVYYIESSEPLEQLVSGRIQEIDSISDTLDFRIVNDHPNNDVVDAMLEASPLLKDETLILAILEKPTPIADNDLLSILYTVAPLSDQVNNALKERSPALFEDVDNYVQSNGIVISPRTREELHISQLQREIKNYHEEALRYWLVYDSTGGGLDSALVFLADQEGEFYMKREAQLRIRTGDFSVAQDIVDDLAALHNGDRHLDDFIEWADIAITLAQEPEGVFALASDETLEERVRILADTTLVGQVNYDARALLSLVFNEPQKVLAPVDAEGSPKRSTEDFFREFEEVNAHMLSIYPNPASDRITVEYRLPDETDHALLQVYSSEGKLINSRALGTGTSATTLNVSGMLEGLYIYILTADDRFIARRKLAITR